MAFQFRRPASAFSLDPSGKKQKRLEDPKHLAFIRTLPCLITGKYGVDACHIRYADPLYRKAGTPKARKPDDAWTVPMVREKHDEQHSMEERLFWRKYNMNPLEIAYALHEVSGDPSAAKKIIEIARKQSAQRRGI
ncbi:DUF968 domain-containing protein [Flexibacterium corallicola]|uniref:DUF968 domain-containing protein n=1 Tax=Flexibacterium corallicola TaxID=3037259 RepID=UPI00286F3C67|nr:hypothetical protein [Pseudovibrio sp. M1P-2-3]